MPPVEFDSEIQASKQASKRLPTYTSDRIFTKEGGRGREGERERFMHSAGFVPAIPTSERLQTYVLKRAAAGIDLSTD